MNGRKVKKTAIYPYHLDVVALAYYLEKLNPIYRISRLIISNGSKYNGEDAGLLYNKPEMGIIVTDNIMEAIDECDCFIITNGTYPDRFRKVIVNNIGLAIEKGKEIICALELTEDEQKLLKKKMEYSSASFTCYPEHIDEVNIPHTNKKLYSPKVPVVFVGEVVSGLDAFEVTLGMTGFLREKGYRTIALTEKPWCGLMNTTPIPDYMRHHNIDDNKKVYAFNEFIKQLERKENPDIIIIQLPGAIMKFNDKLTAGFGITPYLISLAVQAECMVLGTFYDRMDSAYYNALSERFEHQFGTGIDCIHMSNVLLDLAESMGKGDFSFLRIEQRKVNEEVARHKQKSDIPVYNCCNPKECEEMCEQIITALSTESIT